MSVRAARHRSDDRTGALLVRQLGGSARPPVRGEPRTVISGTGYGLHWCASFSGLAVVVVAIAVCALRSIAA
jgi:hypothetical protein